MRRGEARSHPLQSRGPCNKDARLGVLLIDERVARQHRRGAAQRSEISRLDNLFGIGAAVDVRCDDPQNAPENVRRAADDEGFPVVRRCLLRPSVS